MSRRKQACSKTAVWLTNRALADLRAIERFSVKNWGRKTADEYLENVAAALDRLCVNPQILRVEPDLAPGLHFYRVKKHVLVCDYHDQTVIVLTVVHTSMDIPARLRELEPQLAEESRMLHATLRPSNADE